MSHKRKASNKIVVTITASLMAFYFESFFSQKLIFLNPNEVFLSEQLLGMSASLFPGVHVHLRVPGDHPGDVLHLLVGHPVDPGEAVRHQVKRIGLSGQFSHWVGF